MRIEVFRVFVSLSLRLQIATPFSLEGLRYGWHIDPEPTDDGQPVFEQPVLDPCARCVSSGGNSVCQVELSRSDPPFDPMVRYFEPVATETNLDLG